MPHNGIAGFCTLPRQRPVKTEVSVIVVQLHKTTVLLYVFIKKLIKMIILEIKAIKITTKHE